MRAATIGLTSAKSFIKALPKSRCVAGPQALASFGNMSIMVRVAIMAQMFMIPIW